MGEGNRRAASRSVRQSALHPFASLLATEASDQALADALCRSARRSIGADVAWLAGRAMAPVGHSATEPTGPGRDSIAGSSITAVLAAGGPITVGTGDSDHAGWHGHLVGTPMELGAHRDAALLVGRCRTTDPFTAADLVELQDLVSSASLLLLAVGRSIDPDPQAAGEPTGLPSPPDLPAGRLWDMLESAPDAMLMTDPSGRLTVVNGTAEAMFGYDRADLVGKSIELLLPERHRAAHIDHRSLYRWAPVPRPMGVGLDLWARHADGREFPVEVSLSPATGPGDDGHVIAAVRDITSRSETEARLREAEIRFRGAFDDGPVPMALVDLTPPSDRVIIEANQAMVDLLGYDRDELLGKSFADLTYVDDRPADDHAIRGILDGEVASYAPVKRYVRADGSQVWVQLHASPLLRRDGGVLGIAHAIDITEQIRSLAVEERHDALDHAISEIRLAMLRGASQDQGLGLLARSAAECLDADTTILLTRADESDRLAVAASHGAGSSVETGLVSGISDGVVADVYRSGRARICRPADFKDSNEHPAIDVVRSAGSIVVAPLADGTGTVGVLLAVRNREAEAFETSDLGAIESFASEAVVAIELAAVTEAHQRLELLEDRERIGRDMHDKVIGRLFGTGMNLQAMATVLEGDLRDRALTAVEEIDSIIQEIRATIYGVRSQVDWGKGVRGEILAVAAAQRDALGFEPTVTLHGDIDELPADVVEHLLATLREALANIAKYAKATRSQVEVSALPDRVDLSIADNGIGFDPERSVATSGSTSLTNHGLANMAARAEEHDGRLLISSAPNEGTTIQWSVPVVHHTES